MTTWCILHLISSQDHFADRDGASTVASFSCPAHHSTLFHATYPSSTQMTPHTPEQITSTRTVGSLLQYMAAARGNLQLPMPLSYWIRQKNKSCQCFRVVVTTRMNPAFSKGFLIMYSDVDSPESPSHPFYSSGDAVAFPTVPTTRDAYIPVHIPPR